MAAPARLETKNGVFEIAQPEPVMFGRLSVFYAAHRVGDQRPLLIKSFRELDASDASISSFYREIEALLMLRHPNILEIVDYSPGNTTGEPPFLVLPLCKGGNLKELARRGDFMPLEGAIPLLRQIAAAIDYAHLNGVIHGDIKPQNVLLSEDRRQVFLADFGMAKYFEVTDRVVSQEFAGEGTSAYLSPEQLSDNKQTPRSDIYSFGVLAYQLLTGQMPYDITAPLYRQTHARVTGELIDPRDANPAITETVRAALLNALAVLPKDRPASASEFCDMLLGARPTKLVRKSMTTGRRSPSEFWKDLDATGRAGIITAAIAAIAGIGVALVQIIPTLLLGKK
jgi:serine/threonine-protein kinase